MRKEIIMLRIERDLRMILAAVADIEQTAVTVSIAQFLWFCGALAIIATAVGIIVKIVKWIKSPEDKQNAEIKAIREYQKKQDERMDEFEDYLRKDKEAISSIKRGNVVVQQGILALMNHAINGNDIDKLEESRDRLQEYLIER